MRLTPMLIRPATPADAPAIAAIIMPTIRAGETYALDRDLPEPDALAYWLAPDNKPSSPRRTARFSAPTTSAQPTRRRPPRLQLRLHDQPVRHRPRHRPPNVRTFLGLRRTAGYRAMQFNFVISTNVRAVRLWQSLGFTILARLPEAFHHPAAGYVDALVMCRKF